MRVLVFLALVLFSFSVHAEIPVEGTMSITPYIDTQTITGNSFDQSYVSFGGTFAWQHLELDLAHGVKDINCECQWDIGPESGSLVAVRMYPSNLEYVRPYVSYQHISDLFRGAPFSQKAEPTVDFLSVGATVTYFERFNIDISYGRSVFDCGLLSGHCELENSFQVRIKTFPMRTHSFNWGRR